jgi:hypothetical protein
LRVDHDLPGFAVERSGPPRRCGQPCLAADPSASLIERRSGQRRTWTRQSSAGRSAPPTVRSTVSASLDDHVDASGLQIEQYVVGPVEHGRVLWSTDAVGEVGAVMGNDEQRTPGDQRPTGNGNGLAALLRWELQVEDDNKSLAVIGWLPVGGVGAHPIDDHASVGGHAVGLDQSDLRESPRR